MKKQTKNYKIIDIYKKTYSYYGNPTLRLLIGNENGEIYAVKTGVNCSSGYYLQGTQGTRQQLTTHTTRNGNIIIDYARGLEQ